MPRKMEKVLEVKAITHRRAPIYQGIVSEFPPSENSVMRKVAFDAIYLNHLKGACNIPSVTKVACHEMASCNMLFVIQLDKPALGGVCRYSMIMGWIPFSSRILSVARDLLQRGL